MKKIGKVFLIFCVLFYQFGGTVQVFAEEVLNDDIINDNDDSMVKDNATDDDNDTGENIIDDSDSLDDEINDDSSTDDDINQNGDDTEDNSNEDNTEENNNDTVDYDEILNNEFKYNGIFNSYDDTEGNITRTLYLIGNEEGYTVNDLVSSFEYECYVYSDDELLDLEDLVSDSDTIHITIGDELLVYNIVILGDDDSSNSVDNSDVESVINNLFEDTEYYNDVVDVNFDDVIDICDISKLYYAVNNKEKSSIVATPILSPSLVTSSDSVSIGEYVTIDLSLSGLESYSVNTVAGVVSYDKDIVSINSVTSEAGDVYYDEDSNKFIALGEFREGSTISFEFVADDASDAEYVTFKDLEVLNDGIVYELSSDSIDTVFEITYTNNKGGDVEEESSSSEEATTSNTAVSSYRPVVYYVNNYCLLFFSFLDRLHEPSFIDQIAGNGVEHAVDIGSALWGGVEFG